MSRHQPKVGFVSLGCPKALVDSERIITQLRAEGYQVAPSYESADVVVALLSRKPDAVLGLATGSSPLGVYQALAERHRAAEVSFFAASTAMRRRGFMPGSACSGSCSTTP